MGYDQFEALCKGRGIKPSAVSKATGVASSTISSWKKGDYTPKADKLQKIADFFGVPVAIFNDVQTDVQPKAYYFDEETAEIAEDIFQRPDLRLLFRNSRKMTPEDLKTLMTLAEALQRKGET